MFYSLRLKLLVKILHVSRRFSNKDTSIFGKFETNSMGWREYFNLTVLKYVLSFPPAVFISNSHKKLWKHTAMFWHS
ncbi:hypothetical protein BRADI_2g27745v3 [Brachypodium distachyon]|uniref:Uncharacterized protein n=1 Tax=Brachypodium distachyon TaxID=15368 RepID=A0A2K2DAY3_BRADI|nr:hypothetical protein BRADI_2g27745v3 [Brachypodium distachyon]